MKKARKESPVMINEPEFGFVLEYVSDIESARHFYENILGLEVERYHPVFVQFSHFAIASDESLSGNRDPEVYWLVEDVEAAYKDLVQKAEILFPIKQMPFGKVFAIKDPAGRPLYLLEFAQNRPSRPAK
jgi:predicted enzyme related to lactoylglutathione lyase